MPLLDGDKSILVHAKNGKVGWRKVRGRAVPFSSDIGVGQYFSNIVVHRIKNQKPCNVIFTGQAGNSKTYCAIGFARFIQPSFGIEQIAMTYSEVMKLMLKLKEGQIILLDEPSYSIGHREWYKEQNKALVATLRSGRFKVHPLFMPVINKSLLDKVIREHLIQFMVVLDDRGEGTVYELLPSHFEDFTYNRFLCRIRLEMLDINICEKTWCYRCKSFKDNSCQLLRAQYEHKRQRIQDERYKQDLDKSQAEEGRKLSFEQWLVKAYEQYEKFWYTTEQGKLRISTEKIQLVLGCSQTTAQRLRQALKSMTKQEVAELVSRRLGIP